MFALIGDQARAAGRSEDAMNGARPLTAADANLSRAAQGRDRRTAGLQILSPICPEPGRHAKNLILSLSKDACLSD